MSSKLSIKNISPDKLKSYKNNARTHSKKQITQIARSIESFGFTNPILVDQEGMVIAGHGRLEAAKKLGMKEIPTIRLDHLSEEDKKAYILADNKLAEKSGWDKELLRIELGSLIEFDTGFDLTLTGFETPEIDFILHDEVINSKEAPEDDLPDRLAPKRVSFGNLWRLGVHYLLCGDSLKAESFECLMKGQKADMIFTDPPYNVKVDGHVGNKGKIKHDEFAYASGEMSDYEFQNFLKATLGNAKSYARDGALHYICMDWRHVHDLISVGSNIYDDFKNICVWNKQTAGMGSLYRSQHEFICIFKSGKATHINNIELGKHGRHRTNVWDYPGVHVSNHHRHDLFLHPTVKPVQMIADAILDCTKTADIVLDCFAGSGSTLLAAEKTKRKSCLIEYEPKYCDVILERFENMTGKKAELIKGGNDE